MHRKLPVRLPISASVMIPALLIGSITLPANSQEPIEVAQLLNSSSPQLKNAQANAQNFLLLLSQQKFEQARQYLSPDLKNYTSAAQLQQVWQNFVGLTGDFVEIQQVQPSELQGSYSVLVSVRFRNSSEDFVITQDQNQQITSVNFLRLGNIQINAEKFADALSRGEYGLARTYLSPALKKKFLPGVIQQRWQAVLAKTGAFKRRMTSSVINGADYDVVLINLEFANYSGRFLVFFDPLGQIIGFDSPLKEKP